MILFRPQLLDVVEAVLEGRVHLEDLRAVAVPLLRQQLSALNLLRQLNPEGLLVLETKFIFRALIALGGQIKGHEHNNFLSNQSCLIL